MVARILNFKSKTISSAALILGVSTFLSGLLGLLKMRLLAGRFGAGVEMDSFFAAFRVPDILSATLITGGIIVAFLPIFSQSFKKNEKEAWNFSNNILNITFISIFSLCLLLWILTPLIIDLIAPGFSLEQKELTVSLARIMFVSPLIFGISGIFSGILHHFDRFLSYALAPILYNIGIIIGILFFSNLFPDGQKIFGAAWGVVLGALFHFLIQVPSAIKSGFSYRFIFDPFNKAVRRVLKLMLPRTIGQASSQINLMVITAIASTLSVGSVAIFNFANNLYLFPVAIIGVSFAVAAFPSFSRSWASNQREEFLRNFSSSFRQVIFIILPSAFLIFILRAQIVRLALGAGEFGWAETRITAASLGLFSIGLVFASLIPLLVRLFFSFQDTRTPAITSIIVVSLNILLSFLFIHLLGYENLLSNAIVKTLRLTSLSDIKVIGLALAISVSSLFHYLILVFFLKKRIKDLPFKEIKNSTANVLVASIIAGIASYLGLRFAVIFVELETFWAVFFQLSIASIFGLATYLLLLYFLSPKEISLLLKGVKSIVSR